MAVEKFANATEFTSPITLTAGIDAVVTTIAVSVAAPVSLHGGQFRIRVGDEFMVVTAGQNGTSWTVSRGAEGSAATTHVLGAPVRHRLTAAVLTDHEARLAATDTALSAEATARAAADAAHAALVNNPHAVTKAQVGLANVDNTTDVAKPVSTAVAAEFVADRVRLDAMESADVANVKLTGAQTVAGVKTFSSSPIVPTPTTAGQAATKAYADSVAASGIPVALIDAKGDLIVGSAADTAIRKPVGVDGQVLGADAASAGGVTWVNAAILSNDTPLIDGAAASGTSAEASRSDHVHPASVVSAVLLAPTSSATNVIQPTGSTVVPLTIKGAVSQSAKLQRWVDSADVEKVSIAADGTITHYTGLQIGDYFSVGIPQISTDDSGLIFSTPSSSQALRFFGTEDAINTTGLFTPGKLGVPDWGGSISISGSGISGDVSGAYVRFISWDGTNRFAHLEFATKIFNDTASKVALAVMAKTAQTADLQQWQDPSAVVLLAVTAAGLPQWAAAGNQQTTVGSAGGASALPATPTKYLKVVDSGGTTLVIPAYAAA